MRLKDLLQFDLGALLRRTPTTGAPEKPVYWWTRLWRLPRKLGRHAATVPPDALAFPKGIVRVTQDPAWRGPFYVNARSWRRDVILVVEQLRGLLTCNAPLAPGLAAAAREDLRTRSWWLRRGVSGATRVFILFALPAIVGILLAMLSSAMRSQMPILLIAPILIILLFRALLIHASRYDRMAVFLALEHRIACGSELSDAMGSLPRFFPRHLVNLVAAGEMAGNLEPAFDQFNDEMLRALNTQRQLRSVFWYLLLVFSAQVFIGSYLLIKVVPVFAEMRQEVFADVDAPPGLPHPPGDVGTLMTAILPDIDILARLSEYVFPLAKSLVAVVIVVIAWQVSLRLRRRGNWATRGRGTAMLYVPWFRGLVVRHNLGLIALMLHGLLRAGVPLDRALGMTLGSDIHPAYRRWLEAFRNRVAQGDSLKDALHRTVSRRLIPDSFTGLLEAGERSCQLPETLERIAALYQRDTEKRLSILQSLVLPAGIAVLGYLVLATQMSVFRILIDLADSINA